VTCSVVYFNLGKRTRRGDEGQTKEVLIGYGANMYEYTSESTQKGSPRVKTRKGGINVSGNLFLE